MKDRTYKEGKIPADNRVALTPAQCKWIIKNAPDLQIFCPALTSPLLSPTKNIVGRRGRQEDLSNCDVLLGIKEVPVRNFIPDKTYLFFSHTKKKQPYNQDLFQASLEKQITLIDYECLEHEDGQRIIGFGFFAGVVGAHNGMMAYGTPHRALSTRTGLQATQLP